MFKELKEPCLKKESMTHRVQASSVRLTALFHQTSWSQKKSRSRNMLKALEEFYGQQNYPSKMKVKLISR